MHRRCYSSTKPGGGFLRMTFEPRVRYKIGLRKKMNTGGALQILVYLQNEQSQLPSPSVLNSNAPLKALPLLMSVSLRLTLAPLSPGTFRRPRVSALERFSGTAAFPDCPMPTTAAVPCSPSRLGCQPPHMPAWQNSPGYPVSELFSRYPLRVSPVLWQMLEDSVQRSPCLRPLQTCHTHGLLLLPHFSNGVTILYCLSFYMY